MKRIGAFSLAIFIFVLSVFSVIPVYADGDKTVLPCNLKQTMAFSSSDAQAYVAAHKDIYSQDGYLLFAYTPAASYNWNLCKDGQLTNIHMSDKQVSNYIMTNRPFMSMYTVLSSLLANNNSFRGFCSGLGAIFLKDSDAGTKILDTLTGNYNYLDSLNYDEDSQTIMMSNDNGSVDKLREDIKNYWYKEKGLLTGAVGSYHCFTKSYFLNNILKNGWFDYEEDYNEYFDYIKNTDYSFVFTDDNNSAYVTYLMNKSDISYFYLNHEFSDYYSLNFANSVGYNVCFTNITKRLNLRDFYSSITSRDYSDCDISVFSSIKFYLEYYNSVYSFKQSYKSCFLKNDGSEYDVLSSKGTYYFVCDELPLIFKNEASMKSFIEGSDSYLASTINKTGEDITFSIKDMNENLGSKMDELIDSINSNKGNMSADELQNAIDKGLEDLNKNTEDIKDNTSSILDKLEEQNQILLQILGVTEFIAYQEVKENSDQYNMSYLKTLLDSMFTGLFNALMYGENTVDDKNTDTASMLSFSVSNAASPVSVYSDDIAVYDSSGSGGGSSFGGGSDSSGGHFFDLKNGLFGKFPFSIPYQCYNWLQILQREPEAPSFSLDYGYLFGAAGASEYVLTFDLSRYNDIAEVGRSFCRLFMTLMLALGIYHKNKGEM